MTDSEERKNTADTALENDNAGVKIPPPLVVAFWLLLGLYINSELGLEFPMFLWLRYAAAGLFILVAIVMFLWAFSGFLKHKTSIIPDKPDTHLMTGGLFKYSRNPIYLAFLLIYIGLCLLLDAPFALVFLPVVFLWLSFRVIKKEEAYLTRHFGSLYTLYKAGTRRWI